MKMLTADLKNWSFCVKACRDHGFSWVFVWL